MSRIRLPLLRTLVGLLFLGLLAVGVPANSVEATPVRILLTGDSIVQGFHGDYTWRYRLDREFVRQGVPVDFVGSRSTPIVKAGYASAQYLDPDFDRDHFALGGSTLKQQAGWIADEVATQQPEIIVLHCGINDLRNGASPNDVDDRLESWIRNARGAKGDVRIVVSPILDAVDPARPWLSEKAQAYNELAKGTVADLTTPDSPLTMADTSRGWSVTSHTAENLHPNPTGETLIAQRIAETFQALGILTQTPDIYRWTSWNRQPHVGVTIRNQQVVLSWDAQALTGARVSIRRAGYAAYFPATVYGGSSMTTSPLVAQSTYEFRVSLVRGRMQTPLGPATRIITPAQPPPAAVARVVVNAAGVSWTRSTLATRYLLKFRRAKTRRWVTVRTTLLAVSAGRVSRARVWAVNASGRSAVRIRVR